MRLSWNEIRVRAAAFAEEWEDAHYERGESQTFYNEFFEVFGVRRRKVASFEEPVKLLGDRRGFVDLFWTGVLLVEQKSAGFNLEKAKTQAFDYFPGISDRELVDVMPSELRKAHRDLDATVDKLYHPAPVSGDRDRVEHLFGMYEKLIAPLAAAAPKTKRAGAKRVK